MNRELITGKVSLRAVVFGVAWTIFITVFLALLEWFGQVKPLGVPMGAGGGFPQLYNPFSNSGIAYPWLFFILFPSLIMFLLPRKFRFNAAEWALIYAMIAAVPMTALQRRGAGGWFNIYSVLWGLKQASTKPYIDDYLSPLLAPKSVEVADAVFAGGISVDWGFWMPYIAYWIALNCSVWLFLLFGAAILSEIYINVESLAFPLASASLELTESGSPTATKEKSILWSKFFWLAFAISLVQLVVWQFGTAFMPGTVLVDPEVVPMSKSFTQYQWVPGCLIFNWQPLIFGWPLLLPLDVTISTPIFWAILYWIVPAVWIYMGVMPPVSPGTPDWKLWTSLCNGQLNSGINPFGGYSMFGAGAYLGLLFIPLIIHHRQLISSLKMAFHGQDESKKRWYQLIWSGWAVFGLILIVLLTTTGIAIQYSILFVFWLGSIWTAIGRASAEGGADTAIRQSGMNAWASQSITRFPNALIASTGMLSDPTSTMNFYGLMHHFTNDWGGRSLGNPVPWYLSAWGYAAKSQSNVSKKQLLLLQLVGTVLAIAIAMPLGVWLMHTWGMEIHISGDNRGAWNFAASIIRNDGTLMGFNPEDPRVWQMFSAGVAVIAIIYIGRILPRTGRLFAYISPVAVVMPFLSMNIWFPCIIASIVRLIAYRVGGIAYEQKYIRPIGLGLVCSQAIFFVIAALALVSRGIPAVT